MLDLLFSEFNWYRRLRGEEWILVRNTASNHIGWRKVSSKEMCHTYGCEKIINSEYYHPHTKSTQDAIESKNLAYSERDKMLLTLCHLALQKGLTAAIGKHEGEDWEDEWMNVIYIELPTGQVSFHIHNTEVEMFFFLPKYFGQWDGHTTDQKWQRLFKWSNSF
jgi:hypothetical protein